MGTYAKQKKEEKKQKKLAKQAELLQHMQKQSKKKQVLNSILIGVGFVVVALLFRGARTSSQTNPTTKDERRIAMETAACNPSLAGTTRYSGYGCYEYCNGKQRERKSGCSDSPDNSQYRSGQPCVGLPANAQRNGASTIDQVRDGSKRYPTTTGRYNEEVSNGECTFSCQSDYEWDSASSSCQHTDFTWNATLGKYVTYPCGFRGTWDALQSYCTSKGAIMMTQAQLLQLKQDGYWNPTCMGYWAGDWAGARWDDPNTNSCCSTKTPSEGYWFGGCYKSAN